MAGFSGGSVSFSGGPDTYSVSWSAPTMTWTTGSQNRSTSSSGGAGSVSCGGSVSQTYYAQEFLPLVDGGTWNYYDTTVSGTAPACAPPPPTYPPGWSDNTLGAFTATVAYSDAVNATNMQYSGAYSVSVGSLPTGISLNTSTGAVTGTPSSAGQSYSFTLRAANSYGAVTAAFSGTVAAAPTAGKLKVWNGSAWVYGPAKVWNGSTWAQGTVKVWNGTGWVTSV